MGSKKIIGAILAALLFAVPAMAESQYGEAFLEEGKMTVLRDNKPKIFTAEKDKGAITILEKDLIRMSNNSRVRIETREKAQVNLGSNAILQVEAWKQRDKNGNMRMLFGRFRTKVTGLVQGEEFNVKTATATIGVKGTEYICMVAANGNTTMIPVDHVVQLEGLDGLVRDVSPGQISVVVNGQRATPPTQVPKEIRNDLTSQRLDSPSVESHMASSLPGESALVQTGIVDEGVLMESKVEEFTLEQALLKPIGEMESMVREGQSFSKEAEIK